MKRKSLESTSSSNPIQKRLKLDTDVAIGCDCLDGCISMECPCIQRSCMSGPNYTRNGYLAFINEKSEYTRPIFECNPPYCVNCFTNKCFNMVVTSKQSGEPHHHGRDEKLQIFDTGDARGQGLMCKVPLKKGKVWYRCV